ncbi:MAG: acyl-CoA dehydrogenase family protein [OCS116 cluster bacterium]|nr:acyl-CoA dehydrogenase family protein [OCS116 cluster bacterium]
MDFSLSDLQQMMQDSVSKFIQKDYDFETRQSLVNSDLGYSEDNWKLFSDLGWLGLPINAEYGGIGGNLIDTIFLQEELGKGLVVEPIFSTLMLGANLVQKHGSSEQKTTMLEDVISGKLKLALAHAEGPAAFDITQISTTARKEGDKYILNGHKSVVIGGASADKILICARTSGKVGDENGISIFIINPDQQGTSTRAYTTNDGMRAADIKFNQVILDATSLLGEADTAFNAVDQVLHEAIVALSAEAIGIMGVLIDKTAEYLRTRQQFGNAIGRFQVLQHRMADMFMETEQAKSMLYFAAIEMAENKTNAKRAAKMLKVKIGSATRFVGQQAVQLHGGMGVSDELDIGHYFKRLTSINTLLGSKDYHLNELIKIPAIRQ